MSALNDILDAVVTLQNTLALQVAGENLTAEKRKLPKREEPVDGGFLVCVSGAEQVDQMNRIGFGGCWQCFYAVDITLMTPNDRDQVLALPDHAAWREGTRALYQKPLALTGVDVRRVEVVQSPFLNRGKLAQGYDYNQVSIRVTTYERRT